LTTFQFGTRLKILKKALLLLNNAWSPDIKEAPIYSTVEVIATQQCCPNNPPLVPKKPQQNVRA
jgi:hypothetical protein